jgi:hypothetical protein
VADLENDQLIPGKYKGNRWRRWKRRNRTVEEILFGIPQKLIQGEEKEMPTFKGKSESGAPIISAGWWKKGANITGVVMGVFDTAVGKCYNLALRNEISVPGEFLSPKQKGTVKGTDWSMGALKGFEMAIRSSGCGGLRVKDFVRITCVGFEDTNKGNPRVDFEIEVTRDPKAQSDIPF